jgi:hypothetical protein
MMGRSPWSWRLTLGVLCLSLLGAAGASFRYSRTVSAPSGWALLELPDDVLARARPGLPDLRLQTPSGELAYTFEERLVAPERDLPFFDFERLPGRESRGLVDRGEHPELADGITLAVEGDVAFLKPLVLEASDDRSEYREIARTSIFRTPAAVMTSVRFAPNDRRYLRVRLDDRGSEPVRLERARLTPVAPATAPERQLPVTFEQAVGNEADDVFTAELPSQNLPATGLSLAVAGAAFSRRVRVYEVLVFRDDLTRRLVAEGRIERSASGADLLRVPLSGLTSGRLEIEIERRGAPLGLPNGTLFLRPKRLLFRMPEPATPVVLRYGSPNAEAPSYDLDEALSSGLPRSLVSASLGPVLDHGERSSLPRSSRGPAVDEGAFARKRAIILPSGSGLAYLDLVGVPIGGAEGVRIVDASGRQVPFIVETQSRVVSVALSISTRTEGRVTVTRAKGLDPKGSPSFLELRASSPPYFRRQVSVYELTHDDRGPTERRILGQASWEHRPEDPPATVSIPLTQPSEPELVIEIEHGDNPPLVLSDARVLVSRARIDFLFEPGDRFLLLSDNPDPSPAAYDLGLLQDALVKAPALRASLVDGPARSDVEERAAGRPGWFWFAIVGALLVVVAALVRVLRGA